MTPDPALTATAPVNHQRPTPRWRRWAAAAALVSPVVLAIVNEFPLCPSAGLLGLPCPGCGLTRATLVLARGEFSRALALHPLVIPLAPMYFTALALLGIELLRGPSAAVPGTGGAPRTPWITRRWVSIFGSVVLAAALTLWVLRFFGYFGGPVPVQTYGDWAAAHTHR